MEIPKVIDGIPVDEYRVSMTKIPKDELVRLYIEEKKSVKDIAGHFKCSYRTIYRRLHRLDIKLNKKIQAKKLKNYLGKKQLSEILKKNLTIDEIAKKLRTTPETVRRYIQKYGL